MDLSLQDQRGHEDLSDMEYKKKKRRISKTRKHTQEGEVTEDDERESV